MPTKTCVACGVTVEGLQDRCSVCGEPTIAQLTPDELGVIEITLYKTDPLNPSQRKQLPGGVWYDEATGEERGSIYVLVDRVHLSANGVFFGSFALTDAFDQFVQIVDPEMAEEVQEASKEVRGVDDPTLRSKSMLERESGE